MAEINAAQATEITVDVETLNRMPLGDVLRATEAARVIADGVCSGPVQNTLGERYWLIRIEGRIAAIGKTEVEALEASEATVLRYLARRSGLRARWEADGAARWLDGRNPSFARAAIASAITELRTVAERLGVDA